MKYTRDGDVNLLQESTDHQAIIWPPLFESYQQCLQWNRPLWVILNSWEKIIYKAAENTKEESASNSEKDETQMVKQDGLEGMDLK